MELDMKFVKRKLSIVKIAVTMVLALSVNAAYAADESDDLFIDQLNGMTRLERLKPASLIKSNNEANDKNLSDTAFIDRMYNSSTSERLMVVSSLARRLVFNNGKERVLKTANRTIAPSGYFRLCADKALAVCKKKSGNLHTNESGQILLNSNLLAELQTVNENVNNGMRAQYEKIGAKDNWQVNLNYGDCEDFALTKKAKLIKMGWPSSALLITIVDTEWGERHAVLTVSTRNGDYLLDNLMNKVINVEISKYKFISRQGLKEGYTWVKLA